MTAAPAAPSQARGGGTPRQHDRGADGHATGVRAPTRTRVRFALMSVVLIAATTVCVLVVNLLAQRFPARLDATETREQALSPRTAALLASLPGEYEIVIAADWNSIDRRASRRVRDVLDLFARSSRLITATTIDTATAAGAAAYERLLRRLAERDAPKAVEQTGTINGAIGIAGQAAAALEALSPRLQAVRDAIPPDAEHGAENRKFFDYAAAWCRTAADDLPKFAGQARERLAPGAGPLAVPDLSAAAGPLKDAFANAQTSLRQIADNVRVFAESEAMPAGARSLARPLATDLARLRDTAAVQADALGRLPKLDSVRVARTLEQTQAALVIGPAGVTAVPLDWLFPASEVIDGAGESRADMRRRNEEVIATALDSLARPISPILVIVHSWPPPPLLGRRGFEQLVQRLGLRNIDVVEWAAAEQPEPPALGALDPKGNRPVVYATFSSDTIAPTVAGQTGVDRANRLGGALARLVEEGKPILLSIIPSIVPTTGSPDRAVSFLPLFGLRADSARPLMRDTLTAGGRVVIPDFSLIARDSGHPIAGALGGLRTLLEWPLPLKVLPESEAPRATVFPLIVLDDGSAWAESEWLGLWQTAAPSGGRRTMPPNPPALDASRDDAAGPWVVAAAAERSLPSGGGTQRLVVVSSNTWFMDRVTMQRAQMVDGRVAAANPGNIELLESAVYWLAGQDDRIGASPTARAVPVIRDLGAGALNTLRWLVILGLPALTLGAGVLWRFWRG